MKYLNLILPLLKAVVGNLSPEFREQLKVMVAGLETKAKATKNPFDDLAVELLKGLLGI